MKSPFQGRVTRFSARGVRALLGYFRNRPHVRSRTPRSMKIQSLFCWGRCQPRLRWGRHRPQQSGSLGGYTRSKTRAHHHRLRKRTHFRCETRGHS